MVRRYTCIAFCRLTSELRQPVIAIAEGLLCRRCVFKDVDNAKALAALMKKMDSEGGRYLSLEAEFGKGTCLVLGTGISESL